MPNRRAQLPLDPAAVQAANEQLWARYPELEGRQLTLSSTDAKYRTYWMNAYLAAHGTPQPEQPKPPGQPVEACPDSTKPECGKSQEEYLLQAEDRLASAGRKTRDRNKAITRAYASMYQSDPSTFKWAGMAAFASCKVGEGMQEAQEAQSGWKKWPGSWLAGVDGKQLEDALKAGNDGVFGDIYWQHLAYQGCGLDDIEKAYQERKITKPVMEAWRKIDQGKKTGNQDLVWEGNAMLLKYEQQELLQAGVYDTNPTLWKNASEWPATWYREIESPIPGDRTSFQDYVEDGNIGKFDDRWKWIEGSMLPKWKELDKDPADVMKKLEPCIK